MTTKECQKLSKELLAILPGFFIKERFILKLSPTLDFLYGLGFENTSDRSYFHVWMFFLPLFIPREGFSFTYGHRIGNALSWRLNDASLLPNLHRAIQDEAVPFFGQVSTFVGVRDYLKSVIEKSRPRVNSHILEAFAYTLLKVGDNVSALKVLAEQKKLLEKSTTSWVAEQRARAELMEGKILLGSDGALTQLETWRNETISKMGLPI